MTNLAEPAFPLTVPASLWDAMATAVRETFADSYLWGATLIGNKLEPRTLTAWDALRRDFGARKVFTALSIELVKPLAWDGDAEKNKPDSHGRPDAAQFFDDGQSPKWRRS